MSFSFLFCPGEEQWYLHYVVVVVVIATSVQPHGNSLLLYSSDVDQVPSSPLFLSIQHLVMFG